MSGRKGRTENQWDEMMRMGNFWGHLVYKALFYYPREEIHCLLANSGLNDLNKMETE